VPLTPLLTSVMQTWFKKHSAGFTFLADDHPLTPDQAHRFFKRTFAKSKWKRVKGWHVFRHSFASNCAAKGTDQRSIDTWMGHQTEEQRRRYRHLFPDQQHKELGRVFS
jgi:integrase